MANSKITFTFIGDPVEDDVISFSRYKLLTPATNALYSETFIDGARPNNFFVPTAITIDPPYPIAGTASAINFEVSFFLDFSATIFTMFRVNNVVTIECLSDEWGIDTVTVPATVTYVVDNLSTPTFLLVSDVIDEYVADPCNFYRLDITATEPIKSLKVNNIISTVDTPNVFKTIGLIRGITKVVSMIDVNDVEVSVGSYYYDFLTSENINITIIKSSIGATIVINVLSTIGLDLEYSLDDINWQTSNIFTGQAVDGEKTMYVRDHLGCKKTKLYEVTEFGTRDPFVFISDANSINYKIQEDVDGYSVFRNEENSLTLQDFAEIRYCGNNLFQTNDTTPTQIKSNFTSVTAVVREEDGTETSLTVVQKSENLNRFKRMTCIYSKYRTGKLRIYFETGNVYNDENDIIGTYTLNGNLPDFAIVGGYITISELGTFEIKDVLYDEDIKKRVIIIDYTYEGSEQTTIIDSIYDLLPFEVYEFDIDWSQFGIGTYDVLILNSDNDNDDISYLSENIIIKDVHLKTVAMEYYNNNNRDIFYGYGMKNFIRVPYLHIKSVAKEESSILVSDDSAAVINSSVHELENILFDDMSKNMKMKVIIALSCENLTANGIARVKDGETETNNINNTNIYEVSVNLLKSAISYSNKEGHAFGDLGLQEFEIPSILEQETGFIKT